MPQLDVTSFTAQILWLVAIYFTFYILLLKYILPRIGKILKFRKNYKMTKSFNAYKAENKDLAKTISAQLNSLAKNNLNFFEKNNNKLVGYSTLESLSNRPTNQNNLFKKNLESLYIKKQLLEKYEEEISR